MSNSISELGSNRYINTDSIRALGIGISSAADHEILRNLGDLLYLMNGESALKFQFQIVRPAPTPRVYVSTGIID